MNPFNPILPVRIYTSNELSCFRNLLNLSRTSSLNIGLLAGSFTARARRDRAPSAFVCQYSFHLLVRASSELSEPGYLLAYSVLFIPLSRRDYTALALALDVSRPYLGGAARGRSLPSLLCRCVATTVQALRISSPFPVISSRASKSASLLSR